jgi:DNA (cytosine-5)-methyltransferase 1
VVSALAGLDVAVPRDGWGTEGVALGPNGLVEWSVLDAQWFGLAQRRKRVFAVLDTGDWTRRGPVLLEPESLRGDSPPRREAGQSVAGTLTASALDGSGACGGDGRESFYVADVCPTLAAGSNATGDRPPGTDGDTITSLVCVSSGQANAEIGVDVAPTLTLLHEAPYIACAPIAFDTTQVTSPDNRSNPQPDGPCHPLAASGHPPALAYRWNAGACEEMNPSNATSPTLRARGQGEIAFGVRRLTPRECERLQGAPDDWTRVNRKGKPMKDSPRYKIIGNSFAVPVVRWIGERIAAAHEDSTRGTP